MTARIESPWSAPSVVAGFASSAPNPVLMRFADEVLRRLGGAPTQRRALDLGCGAGRNAVPLAGLGFKVVGVDNSWPMLVAAQARAVTASSTAAAAAAGEAGATAKSTPPGRLNLALTAMDRIPLVDGSCDFVVAHGIWNLARSTAEFRQAVREAARVSVPGAALFVFTFSRHTFPPATSPVAGERFVFTQFSGQPQCFLTAEQLFDELAAVGFTPDPAVPLTEYNRPLVAEVGGARDVGARPVAPAGAPPTRPVIFECAFRFDR
ncbi:MAG: class I SAM-dependent methyltransferase [Thermoanaerobaculia bacterium]